MREFGFELALCAHLERAREGVVSRQLGAGVHERGGRIVDTVHVAPGPEFDERVALSPERIPAAAIEAVVGPGRWRPVREAFPDGPPERAGAIAEWAADVGFFERTRRNGRECVRQVARYPDWVGEVTVVENKPDLGRPGALAAQLRTDVSLGLADRAILATESHVTGAHLNRIPEEVGVWRYHPDDDELEVVREATPLDPEGPGVELVAELPGRTDVRVATAAEKARARRRLAERAYGKGWRTYDLPACANCDPDDDGLPRCAWADRVVDPASECGADCPGHDPAEPASTDLAALRAERTAWNPDPPRRTRRQSGLDRFS